MKEAHWYYEDLIKPLKDSLPSFSLKKFCYLIFEACPFTREYLDNFNMAFKNFRSYMSEIPVYGAILLNKSLDKVLCVMNYECTSYSFPKGKVNQNEKAIDCAVREVWEEIGFNISKFISENDYIDFKKSDSQFKRMYIAYGIEENTNFKTNTRKEIGKIEFPLKLIKMDKDRTHWKEEFNFRIQKHSSIHKATQNLDQRFQILHREQRKNKIFFRAIQWNLRQDLCINFRGKEGRASNRESLRNQIGQGETGFMFHRDSLITL